MLEKWGLKFDLPKPVRLIEYLCQVATKDDDLVLDFFAGSNCGGQPVRNAGNGSRALVAQKPAGIMRDA